jgi:holo-[acyl-carrier protein] synthase
MSLLRTGIDLVEIERMCAVIARHGDRFLERVFTPGELADAAGRPASLAARFAAKEAVSKALGTGIGSIAWREIEVLRGQSREPCLILHGAARRLAEEQGLETWALSMSHTEHYAVAQVVAMGK